MGEWACSIGLSRVLGITGRDPVLKLGWACIYLGHDSFARYTAPQA